MIEDSRPLILVCNDDGIEASGVHALVDVLVELGDVIAVCPATPQSAKSMAITGDAPLRVTRVEDYNGARMYKVNGTPVDCVKLAMHTLDERRPDLVVSGINHGSNASINVIYSGTMGAALEGAAFGIPAIGFSLCNYSPDADFSPCKPFISRIVSAVIENGLPADTALNVNIPDTRPYPTEMRVTKACKGYWTDEYKAYSDPHGKRFYWLTGKFINNEPDNTDTDEWCLSHGIVSVVPVSLDRTDHKTINAISHLLT